MRALHSGRSFHTATEVQGLTCTVYFVNRDTVVQAKNVEDWEVGKHGIYVQFADPRTGKQFSKAYLPQTIEKRGAQTAESHSRGLAHAVPRHRLGQEGCD